MNFFHTLYSGAVSRKPAVLISGLAFRNGFSARHFSTRCSKMTREALNSTDLRDRANNLSTSDRDHDGSFDRALFSYTSGRFLYNEALRLRERYVEFNVAALKEAVSQHTGHGRVVGLQKLSEGGFNRVFLATLENNSQAIVKIPYNLSVPKTYATASEAATLTYLRSKGIPAPKVYGWSSTMDNAIGVEYIVMELASGIGLDSKWFELTKKQQLAMATEVVDMESKLFAIPFSATGSVYFKDDLPPQMQTDLYLPGTADPNGDSETFCIGPITDYMFYHGKRAGMQVDSGPCKQMRSLQVHILTKAFREGSARIPSCAWSAGISLD
jgi:hypothetical protein